MQLPNLSTPVSKCLTLAAYCSRMLDKMGENPKLAELSRRLQDGARILDHAQSLYERALHDMIALRVDVTFEDYMSDRRLRRTRQLAEIEDGRKAGCIASQVFPRGLPPGPRAQGRSQIIAMKDVEARLMAVRDLWPQAESEQSAIAEHRRRYQAALEAREAKQQEIKGLRDARNRAKERFIHLYAEVMYSVRAEFAYDRHMQELFFDRVRSRPASGDSDITDTAELMAGECLACDTRSTPSESLA